MNIFRSITLTWWQTGIFKLCLLALGVAVGVHWHMTFVPYIMHLLVVAVVSGAYIATVWFRQ